MKPIIIIAPVTDGHVTIAEAELRKAIEDAYEQGYRDGKQDAPVRYTYLPPVESIPTWPDYAPLMPRPGAPPQCGIGQTSGYRPATTCGAKEV